MASEDHGCGAVLHPIKTSRFSYLLNRDALLYAVPGGHSSMEMVREEMKSVTFLSL